MTSPVLLAARRALHQGLRQSLWSLRGGVASNADKGSVASVAIGAALAEAVGATSNRPRLRGSAAGSEFERQTLTFLQATFPRLGHMRPGDWQIESGTGIARFEQYAHLNDLEELARQSPVLAAALGSDYAIRPDIVVSRAPVADDEIDGEDPYLGSGIAGHAPIRRANNEKFLLHASISCKWTIRSDRTQNSRAEAFNLVRNRKGRAPHIAVVTAEPLPSRLVSIAIGTGDIDCTYHVALEELKEVVAHSRWDDARASLDVMVEGKRLRDISDLPLDLVA